MTIGSPYESRDSKPIDSSLEKFLGERQAALAANYRQGLLIVVGALFASLLVPWYFDQALNLAFLAGFSALVCIVLCRYWYLNHCRKFDEFQSDAGFLSRLGLDFFGHEKRKTEEIDLGESAWEFHRLKRKSLEFCWVLLSLSIFFSVISFVSFSFQWAKSEDSACPGWDCRSDSSWSATKGLAESIELLRKDITQLAGIIAAKPNAGIPAVPVQGNGAVPIDLTLTFPEWVGAIFKLITLMCVGLGGYLFFVVWRQKLSPARVGVLLALAASSVVSTKLGITLNGKVELKSLFSCEHCLSATITKTSTFSSGGLRQIGRSPSFDIGTAEIGETTTKCVAIHPKEFEWADWLNAMKRDWLKRANPSEYDVILIVGAADRQHLRGELADQFDSNVGLAKARAEAVKALLIQLINAEAAEGRDALNDQRVIALTDGPKNTPKVEKRGKAQERLCSPLLAEDRRVTLFISGSPLK